MVWQVVLHNPRNVEEEWLCGEYVTKDDVIKAVNSLLVSKGEEEISYSHFHMLTAKFATGAKYLEEYRKWLSFTKVLKRDIMRAEREKREKENFEEVKEGEVEEKKVRVCRTYKSSSAPCSSRTSPSEMPAAAKDKMPVDQGKVDLVLTKVLDPKEGESKGFWLSLVKGNEDMKKAVVKEIREKRKVIAREVEELKLARKDYELSSALKQLSLLD
jgi:hypothetical protein